MTTHHNIREFSLLDSDAVVAIWRKANALAHPFLNEEFVEQEAENLRNIYLVHAQTWLIEHEGGLVGFIAMIEAQIGGLFLDPAYHGRGLGRAMVDYTHALKGPLNVEVFSQNAIGRRFYDAYGFVETGRYLHEPSGQDTIQMAMPHT